jgi:protein-disulfide isomerase
VEYLSFTCPHCAAFHGEVYPKLKADYIDTGKVRLDYHEVYFDQLGLLGGMLARCGGELRYMGITDILLDKQRDWAGAADMNAAVAQLKKIGLAAGMDDATVDACLRDQALAEALVANYQKNIETDYPGDTFSGTPSFIINGTQHSNMDYAELKAIIDAELAK